MKIIFERYHFGEGVVEQVEREIDSNKVLAGNAFYQLMERNMAKKPPKKPKPRPGC